MKFSPRNIERIIWLGLIIVVLLLFKRCGDRKSERIKQIQADAAQLQIKHKLDSADFAAREQRWQDSIHMAGLNSDLQAGVIKETERKLSVSQSKIRQLTEIIRSSPEFPDTSNAVLVSRDYKDACDSLPNEIDKQNLVIADLQQNNTDLVDLMNYEIIYRDSLIEAGNTYRDSLRTDYNKQKGLLNEALKVGKPRGRLLGGVGLIGNELNPLSGTKINIAYQSKGGKQYQVGGILLRGQVYYEAGVLITLIK